MVRNFFHFGVWGCLGYAPRVCWGSLRFVDVFRTFLALHPRKLTLYPNDGLEKVDFFKIWPFLVSILVFWGVIQFSLKSTWFLYFLLGIHLRSGGTPHIDTSCHSIDTMWQGKLLDHSCFFHVCFTISGVVMIHFLHDGMTLKSAVALKHDCGTSFPASRFYP